MHASAIAVVGYAGWTLLLLVWIAAQRVALILSGGRAPNSFGVDGSDVSAFSQRLCRAHANCYENLPIFAALVLTALVAGHAEVTDPLALWVLGARVGQSTTHLISTHDLAVQLRFAFFLVQILAQAWWVVMLLRLGLSGTA